MRDLRAAMDGKWSVKVRAVLGPRPDDDKRITILGRGVIWRDGGATEHASDPAHRKAILKAFDLDKGSKGIVDMGLGRPEREMAEKAECDPANDFAVLSLSARPCYLSSDRPDIAFAVKELSRRASCPCANS